MVGNVANHGYLIGVIYKEISAGRSCEVTGSVVTTISNVEKLCKERERLIGKFGEVVNRKDNKSLIATRDPPMWAREKMHKVVWECDEMLRWDIPEEMK